MCKYKEIGTKDRQYASAPVSLKQPSLRNTGIVDAVVRLELARRRDQVK
jgi:hypothetical protein